MFSRRQWLAGGAAAFGSPLLYRERSYGVGPDASGFRDWPPLQAFRPHTRWWWPGGAVTKEGISRELRGMQLSGLGGVEIMYFRKVWSRGETPYMSPRFREMVTHALARAKSLGMEVALTFGPGWDMGGHWVPPEDRSKVLAPAWLDVDGPRLLTAAVPRFVLPKTEGDPHPRRINEEWDRLPFTAPDQDRVVALCAGRLQGDRIDGQTLVDITDSVRDDRFAWQVPSGRWRIAAFRLRYTGQRCAAQDDTPEHWVVDHFDRGAVGRCVQHLGGELSASFGQHFGKTLTSIFIDSFEVEPLAGTLLWSNGVLADFARRKSYELTRFLPALFWDIGQDTRRVRYDFNQSLHQLGIEAFYQPLLGWCSAHGVTARIQPHYRFATDVITGAGLAPRSETEVTTARFETVAYPRKSAAAGARFYGRGHLSAEAYTFIHPERYRATLADMKIATDAFLRDGVTQLFNHGYFYTPETAIAPERDFYGSGNPISHLNPWWPHYKHLAAYISRCCALLRQGQLVADVLIYAPQAALWAETAVFGRDFRAVRYGDLPKTLLANGYDYDPVSDEVLQVMAKGDAGRIRIRDMSYRFLILPDVRVVPLPTLQAIRRLAAAGALVIALGDLPTESAGLRDHHRNDALLRDEVEALFGRGGSGRRVPGYRIVEGPYSSQEKPYQATPPLSGARRDLIGIMSADTPPDFALDGGRQSDGLTFIHRRQSAGVSGHDVYFVTNLQPRSARETVTFRVAGKTLERWDPMDGRIEPLPASRETAGRTAVALDLDPWQSAFFVFGPATRRRRTAVAVARPPSRNIQLHGRWTLTVEGVRFPRQQAELAALGSWTEDRRLRHLSGTGAYVLDFELPSDLLRQQAQVTLDLGVVHEVAEVRLNGKALGVRFMAPYRFDVSQSALRSANRLEVWVTNTLQNHVSGLEGSTPLAADLVDSHGGTHPDYAGFYRVRQKFLSDRQWPPLPSGLLGPVALVFQGAGGGAVP